MGNSIINYLCEASVTLLALYGLYYFCFRTLKNFRINRFYLLFALAASLLIPLLSFNIYPVYLELQRAASNNTLLENTEELVAATTSFDIYDYLFIAYTVVVFVLVMKLVIDIISILTVALTRNRIKREEQTLVVNDSLNGVHSFFNFIFCNDPNTLSEEVFTHEKVHVKQIHSLDIIFVELVKCLLWFNPVIYLMRKSIKLNHEFICDHYTSQLFGIDSYSQLMISKGRDTFRFNIKNDFSMLIKNRLIMLFNKDDHKRIWRYFLIMPLLLCLLSLYSFESYYVPVGYEPTTQDTIPDLKVIERESIDTTTVFDHDLGEERVIVVKNIGEYVEVIDTIVVFDASTYEETVTIRRNEIPIHDYYKKRARSRYDEYAKSLSKEMKEKNYRIDTIALMEYETGAMIKSVVHKINECYTFFWGDYAFSDSHSMSHKDFKKIINAKIRLDKTYNKECPDVNEYSFRVVIITEDKDPKIVSVNNSRERIHPMILNEDFITDSTKLFIEDIKVNGDKILNGIVISLY